MALCRAALLVLAAAALTAHAQTVSTPAAAPPETPLKEISVAADAFVRGAPLPTWADVLPVPAAAPSKRPISFLLEDAHLLVGDKPVVLLNAARQVNDASALGQIGQVSMYFIPQYQRLLVHKILIVRGAEVIDHTLDAQVRFLQREAGLEQGVYSGVITATVLLPDVRVGDILHLQYSIAGANPIFGDRYAQTAQWQRPYPVQVQRVTLNEPEKRQVQWKWIGGDVPSALQPTVTTQGGMRRLRFEQHDMPGVEGEPLIPRSAYPLRWLQFSEFADWAEVSRWADGLFPATEALPPELAPLIERWQKLPSKSDQASQALQWVQSNIRYYSVSLGESSHRPHSPAEVLGNRYGDCKDKSFLLMRILQTLGIPARAVLASLTAPQGPALQIASPLAFDHAVVQVHLDGRDYYLDATRLGQVGALDRMGQGLEEASVLVVDAHDVTGLVTVRSPNRGELFRNELTERFRIDTFGEDGELDIDERLTGLGAETMRLTGARLDAAGLRRAVLTNLERRYPGITPIGTPELQDDADQNRMALHAKFKVPKLAVSVDNRWVMRFVPANLQGAIGVPQAPKRNFPLTLPGFPTTFTYLAEVQWPKNVSVVNADTLQLANPAFKAEVGRSFHGNVSRIALRFEPLTPNVSPKDYAEFTADAQKLLRTTGNAMSVSKDQVKGDGFLGIGKKTMQDSLRIEQEASVERTSKVIAGGQLGGDDLAQTYCTRAEANRQLGNAAAALQDAQEAVRISPSFALAWSCMGNIDWARGEFAAASVDFSKALTLGESPPLVYYRRGQARFFEGRLEAASDDFAKATAARADPAEKAHAMLWQAWTLQRLGRPLPPEIVAFAALDPKGAWPQPALALFTGQLTPEQLLQQIGGKTGDDRELALTEGWFYIGEYQLVQSNPAKAREAFDKARAQGITRYVEHDAAGLELQRLGAKP